jgi:chromate transporter
MRLLQLFWLCLRVGLFTFGGGMAIVPLVQQSLVSEGFMTMDESIDMIAVSQMTPGPFAVNAATFAGTKLAGFPGAVLATLGMTLPSVLITLLVARFFFSFHKRPAVRAALGGIRPAVLALITGAVWSTAQAALILPGGGADIWGLVMALAVFALLQRTKVSPALLLLLCGAVGAAALR